jgi:hypothetical protein
MTEITFVKTRHEYMPYGDLFKLVELSGFPVIFVDQLDVSQHGVFIVSPMNGEWRPHIDNQSRKPRNAHLILWNLERPDGSAGSVGQYAESNRQLIYSRFVDEVWCSDRRMAEETTLRFVPLGSDERLGQPGDGQKRYHFCHLSYEVPRRQTIYKHFDRPYIGPNCWPPERDQVLQSSKFALNVHQDHHPFQEPLRFALFAAYGLPIISETIYDAYPWSEEFMIFAGYDHLVRTLREALSDDYRKYREMGLRARERMCKEYNFRRQVELAVEQSYGRAWR